jgi:putative peptide zinc metalloprotease protein
MGIAFLVMWPVLYTDTNEAWKLADKRHRLAIGAAGMLSELALAVVATLLWNVIPDGPLRAGVFLLATTTWIITLGVNASPFMRFDGYFLMSDWLDMPNLHSRAFACGRWWLRRQLFGWDDPPPERLPLQRQRLLTAFAFATWLYRLVVFLGIAFLVYHVFFKLLGFVLLVVELGWFIILPAISEPKIWWKRRAEMRWNKETKRTAVALIALLAFLLLPWQRSIQAPAVLGAREVQGLYAVDAARVVKAPVAVGSLVKAGDILVELESPGLAYRLAQAENREQIFQRMLEQQPFNPALQQDGMTLQKRWAEANAAVKALRDEADRLIVRAPFDGRVAQANEGLAVGAWVADKEKLFILVGTEGIKGQAFIGESEMKRLRDGPHAVTFIADTPERPSVHCRSGAVDRINITSLDALSLASTFGGPIPVQHDISGALVPTEAVFRVRLEDCEGGAPPRRELRGVAHLDGNGSSLLGAPLRHALAAVQREMGF